MTQIASRPAATAETKTLAFPPHIVRRARPTAESRRQSAIAYAAVIENMG